MDTEREANGYLVHSADHVLTLLWHVVERRAVKVGEAARHLGVAPSTAHRLLNTLRHHGFVVQERRGPYRPGPALAALAAATIADGDIRAAARPVLEQLREDLRETVSLLVLEGNQVRFVESTEGPRRLRVASRLGQLAPAHCTSGGKSMLAALPAEELDARYADREPLLASLPSQPDWTWERLQTDLAATRRRGYGVNLCDGDGISGIGACVRDPSGAPLAAVAVACPGSRLASLEEAARLAPTVQAAAAAVEAYVRRVWRTAAG